MPSPELSTLIATGDDGLRAVHPDSANFFVEWMDMLYAPKSFLGKYVLPATTGWLRKHSHVLSELA